MKNKELDVLLINPGNLLYQFGNVSDYATIAQPIGIAMIASYIRENSNYSVGIIDAEVEMLDPDEVINRINTHNPLVVGLTAFTTKMDVSIEIIKKIKEVRSDIKVIIGGHHPSAIPLETYKETNVDYAVIGEGYLPIIDILDFETGKISNKNDIRGVLYYDNENEKIVRNNRSSLISLNDDLPIPAWDLLPMKKYKAHHWQCWHIGQENSYAVVFSSLGCPFKCSFCSVGVVYGDKKVRYITPERFVENIEYLVNEYGIKHFEIIDDTFTLSKKRVRKICDLIIEKNLDINAWCFVRTDRLDELTLTKMRDAGIRWVFFGLESGDNDILEGVSKGQDRKQIYDAVKLVKKVGLNLGCSIAFGIEGDTYETMNKTLDTVIDLVPDWVNFFVSMAYPGTDLFNENIDTGKLPSRWNQYGFFSPDSKPLSNKNLTSREILEFRDQAFNKFYNNERYKSHILNKFGEEVWEGIVKMSSRKLERNYDE